MSVCSDVTDTSLIRQSFHSIRCNIRTVNVGLFRCDRDDVNFS